MKRFFYFLTVMVCILANNSHAMEKENSSDDELKKWEKMVQQNFVKRRNQTRTMPESPKQELKPNPQRRSIKDIVEERRKEKRRLWFKDSIHKKVKQAQLRRAKSERIRARSDVLPRPKGRRYTESLLRFRDQARWRNQRIRISPRPNIITTATVMFLLKKQMKTMNNWLLTLCASALYELLNTQKLILKLPLLPETFKHRLASALRGGLFANIVNAIVAQKLPPYLPYLRVRLLNGWKVIGSYMFIDLVSKYGWDVIKKIKKKPAENTESNVEQDYIKQSSKLTAIIDWGIKTILATAIPDLLT